MRTPILTVLAALAFAGCSSTESEPTETAESASEQRATTGAEVEAPQTAMTDDCPMHVQGTSVQAENIEGGAALVFTTTGDAGELRDRVRNMAATQESPSMRAESQEMGMSEAVRPGVPEDPSASAKSGDLGASGMAPPAEALEVDTRVEDIAGGVRMVLIATEAADVDALRAQTEQQAQQLSAG